MMGAEDTLLTAVLQVRGGGAPRPGPLTPTALAGLVGLVVLAWVVMARPWRFPVWKRRLVAAGIALLAALLLAFIWVGPAAAQTPGEAALRIERQLLCPQCTNLRLDVCDTQICVDMRASIRERLARGESEQQIIEYFTGRYGQRVLAEVPARGFNLVLFGWVGASLVAVAAVGGVVLVRLRRSARPHEVDAGGGLTALDAQTEQWLDEQIAGDRPPPDSRGGP